MVYRVKCTLYTVLVSTPGWIMTQNFYNITLYLANTFRVIVYIIGCLVSERSDVTLQKAPRHVIQAATTHCNHVRRTTGFIFPIKARVY